MTCQYTQTLFGEEIGCEKEAEVKVTSTHTDINGGEHTRELKCCKNHAESVMNCTIHVSHKIKEL